MKVALIAAALLVLGASSGHGTGVAYERVSVIGDSWCAGLDWAEPWVREQLDLHCEPGSTTADWLHRIKHLDLERVVYIQLGAGDYIKWQFFGERKWSDALHPAEGAKRMHRTHRHLRRRGHEVYFLGYNPRGEWSAIPAMQRNYCYAPKAGIDPQVDPFHPTPAAFEKRARWLVEEGCHR